MIIALQTLIFFRESLFSVLDRLLRPYYKRFSLVFSRTKIVTEDDECEEQVFSVYDDERGVVFYPPMYAQRYAAVSDCLMDERWCGKLEKVIDLGYHDMSFVKYLKEVPGIKCILGVDIESIPLRCSSDLFGCEEYAPKRESPLQVTLFQGNAADPDYRLIGCDAVIAIEMIEHMLPHDLDRLVHTIFGFVKPWIVIFTTPNADFNVLFKALERNGLRRLDHFFEWTREQFNDWCSNIVFRYPQYAVTCRGIGPGPPDTKHLGCCSQMALFISKDYHKQQDLNLNSLALVANTPIPKNLSYMISSSDIVNSYTENSIASNIIQSYPELLFSERQSGVTIVITSPSFSLDSLEYQDKISQCNLDSELGKNFLMFNDEQLCFAVVIPRRKVYNKVYEIENINNRLNCTMLQVDKFSKTTQSMMAKNKIDSLVHTREVVDEIRHLTKTLNFNKDSLNQDLRPHVWANIVWGDNAPYWNQYYKIVREYNYPFETKSEECRILDLISDEINKLIDMQYEDSYVDDNKLEIPLQHLMGVVKHITEDVDRVKDLLEWNGYEIVDDVVIHSRLIVDNASVVSQEEDWQENDTLSDWDTTDFHSTSISDGSSIVPDYHGRCLRLALDNKLRKLRSMLTADEDITTELDCVVCRLMKLALRTSKGRQNPPPTRWMQYKLLDLLTLTEKAIDRRKRHFVETYSLKAINYDVEDKSEEIIPHEIKGDDTVNTIVDKYHHLVEATELKDFPIPKYRYPDMELTDDFSVTSTEILKENVDRQSPSLIDPELILNENTYEFGLIDQEKIKFDRVRNWIEKDNIEVVSNPSNAFDNSSGDTENSIDLNETYGRSFNTYDIDDLSVYKTLKRKIVKDKRLEEDTRNVKCNRVKIIKKLTRKGSYCGNFVRKTKYFNQICKRRKKFHSTPSKPIPGSLIELCHPELNEDKYYDDYQSPVIGDSYETNENKSEVKNVSATEGSYLIAIITEDMEETIALRRTIGTDPLPEQLECETVIQCINHDISYKFFEEHDSATENVESQTFFLNDINEPSTSKGIRHISMDVQCGSDNTAQTYSMLSATTSYTKLPKLIDTGIKIDDLYTDVRVKSTEFGTSTDNPHVYKLITPNNKSVGIRIQDSDHIVHESGTITEVVNDAETMLPVLQCLAPKETKLLKLVSNNLKIDDSGSEFCSSIGSLCKNPLLYADGNDRNKVPINSLSKEVPISNKLSSTKYVKPMLCCGAVHIHSYKDKIISEDVVYQGDWQRYRPKAIIKKKSLNSVVNRAMHPLLKRNDVIKNKKPIAPNNREIKYEIHKHIQLRNNVLLYKPRQISKAGKNEKVVEINKSTKLATITNIEKIASKHLLGTLTSKSNYVHRKPIIFSSVDIKKDTNVNQQRLLLKNHIPTYLRQKHVILSTTIKKNVNDNLDTVGTRRKLNKKKMTDGIPLKSKAKEMKSDALKYHPRTSGRMNYFVFRNEINSKNSVSNGESPRTEEKISNTNNANNRAHSPQSQNSSCSSPNSVATIRFISKAPKSASVKRSTESPQKSYIDDSSSEPPTSSRLKKFTKRTNNCKSTKNSGIKDFDNKENLTEKCNINNKQGNKLEKNVFKSNQKSVFIAQLNSDNKSLQSTLPSLSKYKTQYSDFKSALDINVDVKHTSDSPSGSNKRFLESESDIHHNENIIWENSSSNEKFDLLTKKEVVSPSQEMILSKNTVENNVGYCVGINSNEAENRNDNRIAMRQLLEETLSNIISCHNHLNAESEKDVNAVHPQNSISANFKNVLNSTVDIAVEKDLYDSLNTTLEDTSLFSLTDTNINVTDLDLLSFKSIISESKLSESYFDGCDFNVLTPKSNSVRELFERKDEPLRQIPGGSLAVQAFSGFSVDGEPVIGDKPDHINLVDSETGSLVFDIARQATSEEVFVSGRSSDSYESCVIDEDAVVPNWLFNIINQQHSVTEESDSLNAVVSIPLEGPMPIEEPPFDTNGNTVDPGVGSGAGDGRGIHSDHSQDSSGRGTSLSSSETSSGQQSEAIIIDPSTFLEQFESSNENRSTLAVPIFSNEGNQPPDNGIGLSEVSEPILRSTQSSRDDPRLGLFSATSDVDADVSSLNTDVTDSSDN